MISLTTVECAMNTIERSRDINAGVKAIEDATCSKDRVYSLIGLFGVHMAIAFSLVAGAHPNVK